MTQEELVEILETLIRGLNARVEELEGEVQDWRDSAKQAADESCDSGDERHCTCVPLLRRELREANWNLGDLGRLALAARDGGYAPTRALIGECIRLGGLGGAL